ncbi:MAG TPA: peptidoglycan-associated lipoprotein Pal [Mariprofundaceae bacterium]|nr:peptidoglycan-associated lipoprotein Pal [Mariprofundaceae bacterium]
MNSHRSIKIGMVALASAALLFAGCAKKETVSAEPAKPAQKMEPVKSVSKPSTNSVYFAFDSAELDASAQATLDGYAAWLNANRNADIKIEGNCDQRGSREYNLALGQERADSVKNYLSAHGVSSSRVDTVSFGEERPVCKGTGEACWAQNRHADIVAR